MKATAIIADDTAAGVSSFVPPHEGRLQTPKPHAGGAGAYANSETHRK